MIFKKPKFWDEYKDLNFIAYLLLPFTIPIKVNNFFSNFLNKYKTKNIITICVGNIYLGGTGKTPTVIKLFEIFKKLKFKSVVGKKFYKSHLDEIALLKKKTKLLLGESRLQILKTAVKRNNKIVIFDDGLQDNKINYNMKFVCFDSLNWVGNGFLIPSGPLRENLNSLKKFDAVFFKNIKKKNYYIIVNQIEFSDHYIYKKNDILKIIEKAKKLNTKILTTEKDYVKIPKIYRKKINFISIDLEIEKVKDLINFIKLKINEQS